MFKNLFNYWPLTMMDVNMAFFIQLVVSLLLGLLLGYERSYHGKAAGMRTYGLVCMASTAVVVILGYPDHWFMGRSLGIQADLGRVIQGILTGIGFLCAGVIMREGFNISGLSSAASIWSTSVIGILVGVGFYLSAIVLSVLSALLMAMGHQLEQWLPSHNEITVSLSFKEGFLTNLETMTAILKEHDFLVETETISISSTNQCQEWRFVAVSIRKERIKTHIPTITEALSRIDGVIGYFVSYVRN